MASSSAGSLQCLLFFFLCKHCPFLSFIVLEGIHYFSSILALTFLKNINLLILIVGLLLYNIVLVLPYIDMNPSRVYICSPSWTPSQLPPHPIPLGHLSAPASSTLSHASNLGWPSVSHMIIYIFQCHSPKSSHPRPLPQSPKDCPIHPCLFCCLTYRVIVAIFINSIYIC